MSRDLENFAKYFLSAYQIGAAGAEHHLDRQAKQEAAKLKYAHDMAREARESRKTDQWVQQSQAYMNYLNRKGAGGGGAGKTGSGASKFATEMAGSGVPPPEPVGGPSMTVNMPEPVAPPPSMPPSGGGGGGDDGYAAGGRVRPRAYVGGTSGPGSGYGTIAAPPNMRRGGRVPRFAGGGSIESGAGMSIEEASQGGPGGRKGTSAASGAASGFSAGSKAGTDKAKTKTDTTSDVRPTGPQGTGAGGSYTTADVQPGGVLNMGYRRGGMVRMAGGGLFPATSDEDRAAIRAEAERKAAEQAERRRRLGVDPVPPNTMGIFPPTSPADRDRAVRSTGEQIPVPERDINLFPPTSDAGRARMVEQDQQNREATADRRAIRAGSRENDDTGYAGKPAPTGMSVPGQEYPTNTAEPGGGPNDSPDQYYRDDVRRTQSRRPGGGGGGGGGPEPWKKLGDQTRTAAFDYEKDYADPRNIHAVDRWGRSRAEGQASAAAAPAGRERTAPSGEVDVRGPAQQGMSSNNAAADLEASKGASNFAEHTFHLGKADPNSARGYEALAKGHGAPTIGTIEQMRKAVDPEGKLPPNELMRRLRNEVYQFYVDKGDKAKADKSAFEVSQFGNVMAKGHGANAQKMLAKGDIAGATNEIAAGYNWLPNGHTVHVAPDGKSAVIEGPDGKIIHQIPLDPAMLKQVSDGMSHGVFNWDVMNGGGALPASGLNGPGAAPPGGGPGQATGQAIATNAPTGGPAPAPGGLPSPVSPPPGTPPPTQPSPPAAQPSAAPTGPAQPPAAPPTAIPVQPPSSLAPVTQGGPTPPPARAQPTVNTPPPSPATGAPAPSQVAGGPKPGPSPAPAATPPVSQPAPPEKDKRETPEEHQKRMDALYRDNPDYVPQPNEVPPTRRASIDTEPVDPRQWDVLRKQSDELFKQQIDHMNEVAARTKDAKPAEIARSIAYFKDQHKERLAEIEGRRKEVSEKERELNRQESSRVHDRQVQSETSESNVGKKIEGYADAAYKKWQKFDPKEESKKKSPSHDFAYVHQSPLRYMPTADAREKLTDIARVIWQHNPDMSEKEAFNHAMTFTSFVSEKGKDLNGNSGDKGRYYRTVSYDPLGNMVLQNEAGEHVHVPKDTLTLIRNLRSANHKHFKEEMKGMHADDERHVGTAQIIGETGKQLRKVLPVDPLTTGARVTGEAIGAIRGDKD